jgi:hypothetical protein
VCCIAADAPLLGVGREQVEPDLSPREECNVRVEREAGAAQEAERRCVRLPGAATFVRPVMTTSSTQREPNRNLAFLCVVPLPCFHACGRAFKPPGTGAPLLPPWAVDDPRLLCGAVTP